MSKFQERVDEMMREKQYSLRKLTSEEKKETEQEYRKYFYKVPAPPLPTHRVNINSTVNLFTLFVGYSFLCAGIVTGAIIAVLLGVLKLSYLVTY